MEVLVDPLAMESYGLTQTELFNLVARNNKLVAAGALQAGQGRVPVKVPGVFESVADVLSLPVKVDDDRVVHFGDIADVRRTYKDATSYARINGQPAIALEVVQRTGANIILTIERVRALVEQEQRLWPTGVAVTYSRDGSRDIRNMLTDLQNNVISAVLLVLIVIIGILGVRNALLVGIAIPGSFLTASC
jgi:multidrug efflux pump